MKKLIFFIAVSFGINSLQAQQLFVEVFSGYNLTAYQIENYQPAEGYVPIGARLAGGLEHAQIGVEYRQNITDPGFDIDNPLTGNAVLREDFTERYYGAFLRGNVSSLPAYRFGLVIKAGAGMYTASKVTYTLPDEGKLDELTVDYDPKFGFNGGLGVSAPIYAQLHWEIGYQFNYVQRDENGVNPAYDAFYHSFQMGLSLNLVFGNVEKKCRRTISSSRRGRG